MYQARKMFLLANGNLHLILGRFFPHRNRLGAALGVSRAAPVVAAGKIFGHHLGAAFRATWRLVIALCNAGKNTGAFRLGEMVEAIDKCIPRDRLYVICPGEG